MKKQKASRLEKSKTRQLLLLALPAMILVFIFSYIPMAGIFIAFKNINFRDGIFKSPWNGLKNFEFFFKNDALQVTFNTLAYNFIFIVVGLVFALLFAILLNEIKSRGATKAYQTIFFFPYFFSWVIVTYMVYAFLAPNGVLTMGIGEQLKNATGTDLKQFYVTKEWWPGFLVFLNTWKNLGYNSVLYYATIMGISNDYYEAASLDGANKFQQVKYITLPLLLPTITIMTLLAIGGIFRADFGLFYFVPREIGQLFEVTTVIDTYVYRMLKYSSDMGMAAAVGLYQSVLSFIVVLIFNHIANKVDPDSSAF